MRSKIIIFMLTTFICFYPLISLISSNVNDVNSYYIILSSLLIFGVYGISLIISCVVLRNWNKALLYTLCSTLTLFYIKPLVTQLSKIGLYYWHIVPIIFTLLVILILVLKKYSLETLSKQFIIIIFIGCFASFAVNYSKYINEYDKVNINNSSQVIKNVIKIDNVTDKPNVYFIVVDEYCSFNQIKKWYGYDNQIFMDFLTKYNFNIINNGHNESISTLFVTTGYINYNNNIKDGYYDNVYKARENPELFVLFDRLGYSVSFYGGPEIKFKNKSNMGGTGGVTITGESLFDIIIGNSIFYPVQTDSTIGKKDEAIANNDLKMLKILENYELNKVPGFFYIHINGPHVPFVYDEYGNRVSVRNRENLSDKQFYLGAYKYTTKQLMRTLDAILQKDKEAIIFLFSDHSQRTLVNHADLAAGMKNPISKKDASNYFAAVYYQGNILPQLGGGTIDLV